MSKLTDTQDAAIQHHFTEYTEDTWDNMMNLLEPNQNEILCDWFSTNSNTELRDMLICLEQMLQTKYEEGYEQGQINQKESEYM
jgi:hypothetical protein